MASTTGGATGGAGGGGGGGSSSIPAAAASSSVAVGAGGPNPSGSGGPAGTSNSLPDIIDYKVKLLGLLPDGYMYLGGSRRWDLSTACFIKVPSEMTCYDGKIDRKGHPTLIGSGILERKYGLTVQLPTIAESERANSVARESVKEAEEGRDEEEGEHEVEKVVDDDVILEEEEDGDESGNESGSEGSEGDKRSHRVGDHLGPPNFICQGCQHNAAQNQRDNLMTKWLKNNFDPRRDALPDIVCRRTVLTYIMTQKQPFILNAKKISFVSSQDPERKEHKVIHVEFDYLPTMDLDPHPPGDRSRGPSGASKTPDGLPTSEKNFDAESYYEKPNLIGYFAGKLSCKVPTMPPENRSIRILLSAIVDGLWRHKSDPELYTASDLAEVKSTMDTTVVSDPKKGGNPHFFKQVRMAHAWAQCHLVGICRMMVGVHTLVPGNFTEEDDEPAYALTSRPKRILQELWLYDVERMPTAVRISSDEDGFRPWTPTELKWRLYTSLQQIRAQVQNSDEGVTHRFLHYFNEDFLVPMTLEELQLEWKAIHEAYRTLVFRNVHIVQTSPDVIELSMEEVEQEHAEKQVDLILNTFLGLGIPIETVKVVRIMGIRKELEVIFPYEALARRVYTTFRLFCIRNRFLPRGFERIRVDVKRTKRQELERMRRKGSGNLMYVIQNPTPNYNLTGIHERYHHHQCHHQCCHYGGGGGGGVGRDSTAAAAGATGGAGGSAYSGTGYSHHHSSSITGGGHHHHHPTTRSTQPSPFIPPHQTHHHHHLSASAAVVSGPSGSGVGVGVGGGGPSGSSRASHHHHHHHHHHSSGGGHHHHPHHPASSSSVGVGPPPSASSGKQQPVSNSTSNVHGSTSNVVYGRTGHRVPRDEDDPWRYTQTMWR